jgi:MerR family transcriptional regulator, light-induced transcriptional regulator
MTDGHTDLMQQVVERSEPSAAGAFALMQDITGVSAPPPLFTFGPTPAIGVGRPPASAPCLRHIGRATQAPIDRDAVLSLVRVLLRGQPEPFHLYLDDLQQGGLPVEHVFLRLFQPAARHLGDLWAEDLCSFVDVTLAVALLQSGLRRLAPRFQRHGRGPDGTRTILLATLEDDQHTLGLSMTAEFFRRSGWAVECVCAARRDDLTDRLQGEPRTVVGFSISRADQLPALASATRRLRRNGRTRIAGILVGGPLFLQQPVLAREIGADAVGFDVRQGLAQAETLVRRGETCR